MARGKSGRIVLEIDTEIKRQLYLVLEQNQITLKDWFINKATNYISDSIDKIDIISLQNSKSGSNHKTQEKDETYETNN